MEHPLQSIIQYLSFALATTASQLFILLGPGLALAFILYYAARQVERYAHALLRWNLYVYGFQWLGTPVHETGHALFALLFGHKITAFAPFKPDPLTGSLGYVRHTYKKNNIIHNIGNFFIGIGPIILGSLVIYGAALLLLGPETFSLLQTVSIDSGDLTSFDNLWIMLQEVYPGILAIFRSIFDSARLTTWQFWVFLYLAASVGTAITLSPSDVRGAFSGFLALTGFILVFNLATLWAAGDFSRAYLVQTSRFLSTFYAIMLFTLALEVLLMVVFFILLQLKRAFRRG
jgi:hypothetical protein